MSLTATRTRSDAGPSAVTILHPGDTLRLVDDAGRPVLAVSVPYDGAGGREYVAATGDTTTHRAFIHVARDVLVCDDHGTAVPIAGRRLQLDH